MEKVAIITDVHGVFEPLEAVLKDIKNNGITTIYSLGDNIGVGPNPSEILDLLNKYHVISIAGNSEEYCNLGIEPFRDYFTKNKEKSQEITYNKLSHKQKNELKLYPHSIDLVVGAKKIALCHFINDVRCDFMEHSTWSYQDNLKYTGSGYEQFLYTNSKAQFKEKEKVVKRYAGSSYIKGYLSSIKDPLFNGKPITYYDAIIQGHVHFKLYEHFDKTSIYTIQSLIAPLKELDKANYVTLEQDGGNYKIEEKTVVYDREKMEKSINENTCDRELIKRFVRIS